MDDLSNEVRREEAINAALTRNPIDRETLRAISRLPRGFLNHRVRKTVWPRLMGVSQVPDSDYRQHMSEHGDCEQIRADVERSLWNYKDSKCANGVEDEYILQQRQHLSNIILAILCKHRELHYYQGYHDIISVLLLVFQDDQLTFSVSEIISLQFFSDCLYKDFEVVSKSISIIMMLIKSTDTMLYKFLTLAGVEAYFATSWMITWFAHDLSYVSEIARLYDVLLCSHPVFCLYICAALVMHFRQHIFRCECEFAALHNMLTHLPKSLGLPLEAILPQADHLFATIPPSKLKTMATGDLKKMLNSKRVRLFLKPSQLVAPATRAKRAHASSPSPSPSPSSSASPTPISSSTAAAAAIAATAAADVVRPFGEQHRTVSESALSQRREQYDGILRSATKDKAKDKDKDEITSRLNRFGIGDLLLDSPTISGTSSNGSSSKSRSGRKHMPSSPESPEGNNSNNNNNGNNTPTSSKAYPNMAFSFFPYSPMLMPNPNSSSSSSGVNSSNAKSSSTKSNNSDSVGSNNSPEQQQQQLQSNSNSESDNNDITSAADDEVSELPWTRSRASTTSKLPSWRGWSFGSRFTLGSGLASLTALVSGSSSSSAGSRAYSIDSTRCPQGTNQSEVNVTSALAAAANVNDATAATAVYSVEDDVDDEGIAAPDMPQQQQQRQQPQQSDEQIFSIPSSSSMVDPCEVSTMINDPTNSIEASTSRTTSEHATEKFQLAATWSE